MICQLWYLLIPCYSHQGTELIYISPSASVNSYITLHSIVSIHAILYLLVYQLWKVSDYPTEDVSTPVLPSASPAPASHSASPSAPLQPLIPSFYPFYPAEVATIIIRTS